MNEMIERVARVLSPQSWQALGASCDTKAKKKRREASLDYAPRVIKAMREPTKEMLKVRYDCEDEDGYYVTSGAAKKLYQAMIDKALEE